MRCYPPPVDTIERTLTIDGAVGSEDDLTVAGSVRGELWADAAVITIAAEGRVEGDVIARQIIVRGVIHGSLLAREIVEILPGGSVDGRIVAPSLILHEGGLLHATVRPDRLEAAFKVANHRRTASHVEVERVEAEPVDAERPVPVMHSPSMTA
jgi:cytoskeletal protein CcmA (bactofilin family)